MVMDNYTKEWVESIRYKLNALDLDGTLLNSQTLLSAKHIEAVRKTQNAGVKLLLQRVDIICKR
ncbi:HAD hydrolase family protein [Paenibacillus filicis]|uniref:HAD hydrolase family protein n=1 Tax=Paenibacillus gyeongsangnamensis TaxID=3388067 RepID=A0ABT4QLG0_9BACL|nr:HAD hydrolase family protein [Paenibacillus filicis]MCZ8517711.1 HAD hydrolase family protein [Paenibacillus filicis]